MRIPNRKAAAALALVGAGVVAGVAVSGGAGHLDAARTSAATTPSLAATSAAGDSASMDGLPVTWGNDAGRVEIVLDASRSMRTPTTGTTTRMDEARTAVAAVIRGLPKNAQVGLRVFGAGVPVGDPNRPPAAACRDSRLVLPVAPVDPAQLDAVAAAFTPFGYTPTSYALDQAASDLGTSGRRTVILVSDGEESCQADPTATAQRLRRNGIDVQTIGLHADPATTTQLQGVATAAGGTYTPASSSSELQTGLQHILDRMRGATAAASSDAPVAAAAASTATPLPAPGGTPAGARQAQATTGDHRVPQGGFVAALLLVILFFWLKDHK